MQLTTSDNSEKVVFVLCNSVLAYVWLRFLVRMIARWHVMPTNTRESVGLFMMFFSLLWVTLIREKSSSISILMAGGVLVTAYAIVRTLM